MAATLDLVWKELSGTPPNKHFCSGAVIMSSLHWRLSDWLGNSGKRQSDLTFSCQFKGSSAFSGWPQRTPPHASNWSAAAMSYGSHGVRLCQCHVCAAAAGFTFAEENFHLGKDSSDCERFCLYMESSPSAFFVSHSHNLMTVLWLVTQREGLQFVLKCTINNHNSKWEFSPRLIFKIC